MFAMVAQEYFVGKKCFRRVINNPCNKNPATKSQKMIFCGG
jgi:hypothetical protein